MRQYELWAEELLECVVKSEERGEFFPQDMIQLAHGELAALLHLAQGHDGATAKQISQRFGVNSSRVAAMLNSLAKKGFVRREASATDGRMVHVYITGAGRRYADGKREYLLDRTRTMLEKLGEEDSRTYLRIMKRLSELADQQA